MIGVVTGMVAEVQALGRWATHPSVRVAVSGADSQRAEVEAERLVAEGCRVLVSWGLAGGLDPALQPGDLVAGTEVIGPDRARLPLRPVPGMAGAVVLGAEDVILRPDLKAALFAETGAGVVDMETHGVTQVAVRAGIGCVAVRAVSDPAGRALPRLAATALGPEGRPRIGRVLVGLARRPWALPGLLAAKRDSDRALAVLAAVADDVLGGWLDAADGR